MSIKEGTDYPGQSRPPLGFKDEVLCTHTSALCRSQHHPVCWTETKLGSQHTVASKPLTNSLLNILEDSTIVQTAAKVYRKLDVEDVYKWQQALVCEARIPGTWKWEGCTRASAFCSF